MRRVVKPLEALLVSHRRIVLKDSAVSLRGEKSMIFRVVHEGF